MRTLIALLAALLLPTIAPAQTFFGGRPQVTTAHPTTNFFLLVMGPTTNAPARLMSPEYALEVLKTTSGWDVNSRDTAVSNAAIAFTMAASNTLRAAFLAADTTTSNGIIAVIVANDTITSNGCVTFTLTTSNTLQATISSVSTALNVASNALFTAKQASDPDLTVIAGLADPNADRVLFWDDSAGQYAYLTIGTGLQITGTTLSATGGGGGGDFIALEDGHGTNTTLWTSLLLTNLTGNAIRFDLDDNLIVGNGGISLSGGTFGIGISESQGWVSPLTSGTDLGRALIPWRTLYATTNRLGFVHLTGGHASGMAAVVDGSTNLTSHPTVDTTELGYLNGATSAIQTQLDAKQASDSDLTAVAGLSANGLVGRTGSGTAAARTITAGSSKISISNGDGVSGNPTVDVSEGNLTLGNLGGTLGLSKGGTGASLSDPNADRIGFWDDSAGSFTWLEVGSGLNITGTTLSSSVTGSPGGSTGYIQFNQGGGFDGTNKFVLDRSAMTLTLIDPTGFVTSRWTTGTSGGIGTVGDYNFNLFTGGTNRWQVSATTGSFIPGGTTVSQANVSSEFADIGGINNPVNRIFSESFGTTVTNAGTNASIVVDWNGAHLLRHTLQGPTTFSFTNCPSSANFSHARTMTLEIYAPGVAPAVTFQNIDSRAINWQGSNPVILDNYTNFVSVRWDGTNFIGSSAQVLTTGSGDTYVKSTSPTINGATFSGTIGHQVGTVAGTGGALTNFTLLATGDEGVIYASAATNVNLVAIMGSSSSIAYRGTLILTNRTGTSRTFSLGATTNNFISLQQFDGIAAPFTVTNSQAGRFTWEILGTNVQYAYKPMALPSN